MLKIYKTDSEGRSFEIDSFESGSWVSLINPNDRELLRVQEECGIEIADTRALLDSEELSRVATEENYTVIIVDVPTFAMKNNRRFYYTIPVSIIYTESVLITICIENLVMAHAIEALTGKFVTFKKTRFILQLIYYFSTLYLRYLTDINALRATLNDDALSHPRRESLVELYELDKSLVYFKTSLKANEVVLVKMLKNRVIKQYAEDEELLDDLIIENKQALEMTGIYSEILHNTIAQLGAVMDHDLNSTMKLLAAITIIMAIPTVISSFFGMNVEPTSIPFWNNVYGFGIVATSTFVLCAVVVFIARKRNWF